MSPRQPREMKGLMEPLMVREGPHWWTSSDKAPWIDKTNLRSGSFAGACCKSSHHLPPTRGRISGKTHLEDTVPRWEQDDTGNSSPQHTTNPSLKICHSVCNELGDVELWEWDSWKWREGGFWEELRLEVGEGWGRGRGVQGRREDIPAR